MADNFGITLNSNGLDLGDIIIWVLEGKSHLLSGRDRWIIANEIITLLSFTNMNLTKYPEIIYSHKSNNFVFYPLNTLGLLVVLK
jgi:hypothetical protein